MRRLDLSALAELEVLVVDAKLVTGAGALMHLASWRTSASQKTRWRTSSRCRTCPRCGGSISASIRPPTPPVGMPFTLGSNSQVEFSWAELPGAESA